MNGVSENHGPIITSGAMVEFYPISAREESRFHQFGKKVLPGIFLGCALIAGLWKRDILVAHNEELEKRTHRKFMIEESMQKNY